MMILWKAVCVFITLSIIAGCYETKNGPKPDTRDTAEVDMAEDGMPTECLPFEECNGLDDDCDGLVDEDFDLNSDVNHCGYCNFSCVTPNATPLCENGECVIGECDEGYHDINGSPYDGCEYACYREAQSESQDEGTCGDGLDNDCDGRTDGDDPDCTECVPEFCNGEDDDCDTLVDEDFDLRSDPENCGACGNVCPDRPNAEPICVFGTCSIQCEPGFSDENHDPVDGCEAGCVPTGDPTESTCDGIDNDCDGMVDEGYVAYVCGIGACAAYSFCLDGAEMCEPLDPESPTDALCDGIDNDCDGETDEDFRPIHCVGVCAEGATCEGGTEICGPPDEDVDVTCDGLDGDCDRHVDEDYVAYRCGTGACESLSECIAGEESCEPLTPPYSEDILCNDVDDDCDGFMDEDYIPFECGFGECVNTSTCESGVEECTPLDPPSTEDTVCDGLDEDCDGIADEDYVPTTCGTGECERESTCTGGEEQCTAGTPEPETCFDGLDNDCDGTIDNGCEVFPDPEICDTSGWELYQRPSYPSEASFHSEDGCYALLWGQSWGSAKMRESGEPLHAYDSSHRVCVDFEIISEGARSGSCGGCDGPGGWEWCALNTPVGISFQDSAGDPIGEVRVGPLNYGIGDGRESDATNTGTYSSNGITYDKYYCDYDTSRRLVLDFDPVSFPLRATFSAVFSEITPPGITPVSYKFFSETYNGSSRAEIKVYKFFIGPVTTAEFCSCLGGTWTGSSCTGI